MEWMAGGHMGWMAVWWIIVVAALFAFAWFIVAGRGRGPGDPDAEQRLKRRYAAGEIDRETYRSMLDDLRR